MLVYPWVEVDFARLDGVNDLPGDEDDEVDNHHYEDDGIQLVVLDYLYNHGIEK